MLFQTQRAMHCCEYVCALDRGARLFFHSCQLMGGTVSSFTAQREAEAWLLHCSMDTPAAVAVGEGSFQLSDCQAKGILSEVAGEVNLLYCDLSHCRTMEGVHATRTLRCLLPNEDSSLEDHAKEDD